RRRDAPPSGSYPWCSPAAPKCSLCCYARHRLVGLTRNASPLETGKPISISGRSLQLDLDVDAGRQVELHQRVHGLVGRIDDVHQPLWRADLDLVARRLVAVRRAQDVEPLHARRQRHRALDDRAGALGGVDDLERRLVDLFVVERIEAAADLLLGGHLLLSKSERRGPVTWTARGPKRGVRYSRILATTPV